MQDKKDRRARIVWVRLSPEASSRFNAYRALLEEEYGVKISASHAINTALHRVYVDHYPVLLDAFYRDIFNKKAEIPIKEGG